MASAVTETFTCPSCGARFMWRAQIAGKKMACKCGDVFIAPVGAAPPLGRPDSYAMENAAPPPAPTTARDRGVIPPKRRESNEPSEIEEADRGWFRCFVIPPILIILGLLIHISQISWKKPELPSRVTVYPAEMAILMALAIFTILMAMLLAAVVFNLKFGRLWVAALKACGITLFATAVAVAMARLDKGSLSIIGLRMGWSAMILIYWAGFASLFDLELQESFLLMAVVSFGQAVVMWAVLG